LPWGEKDLSRLRTALRVFPVIKVQESEQGLDHSTKKKVSRAKVQPRKPLA
jgi:hypothetical protein